MVRSRKVRSVDELMPMMQREESLPALIDRMIIKSFVIIIARKLGKNTFMPTI